MVAWLDNPPHTHQQSAVRHLRDG